MGNLVEGSCSDGRPRVGQPLRVNFIMEQHLGHGTYADNLRAAIAGVPGVEQRWADVRYAPGRSLFERIPVCPEKVLGMLRGRDEIRRGWCADADVAFFNTQVPAAIAGRQVRRCPYVVAVDVTPKQYDALAGVYSHRADRSAIVRSLKHRLNRRVLQEAAVVVAWSTWVLESLVLDYGVPPEQVKVIAPGVDTQRWRPLADDRTDGPVRILFVGYDFVRKGGDVLLEAFDRLPPGSAELVLVTKAAVPTRPGVRVVSDLAPNSAELLELYQSSDVFALPSRAEAFGIAAVEAAATGLPVVATTVGGLVDIVVDSATGFLVPPGDSTSLSATLGRLAEEPALRRQLGAAARQRAVERFDARRNGQAILSILQAVTA